MKKIIISSLLCVMCGASLASEWVYIGKQYGGGFAVRVDNISRTNEFARFQFAAVYEQPRPSPKGPIDFSIFGMEANCLLGTSRYYGKDFHYSKGKVVLEQDVPPDSFTPAIEPLDVNTIRAACRHKHDSSSVLVYGSSNDLVKGIQSIMKRGNRSDSSVQTKPF